jgi:secondary thiamine-phosphate synthase enzyme
MKQQFHTLQVRTRGPRLTDVTREVENFVRESGIADGLLTCFIRHTSASLVIQENADPAVLRDLEDFFTRAVERGPGPYRHNDEGPDDMPAHIRSALTQVSLSIPVRKGRMVLGTWQAIYLFEHRDAPHARDVTLHIIGG